MKSYVINLDRNPERLQATRAQFDAQGLSFERSAGTDGNAASDVDLEQFNGTRPEFRKRWPPCPKGKMGCFLSHHAIWEKIAASEDPYGVVFEDDLHVSGDLKAFLDAHVWDNESDIVRLETSTNRVLLSKAPVASWRGRSLFKVQSTSWCAGGYIISRSAAKRLVALPEEFHSSTDHLLFSYEDSEIAATLNTLQVVPALCIQDKFFHRNTKNINFQSEIRVDDEGQNLRARLKYALRRSPMTWVCRTLQGYRRIKFAA